MRNIRKIITSGSKICRNLYEIQIFLGCYRFLANLQLQDCFRFCSFFAIFLLYNVFLVLIIVILLLMHWRILTARLESQKLKFTLLQKSQTYFTICSRHSRRDSPGGWLIFYRFSWEEVTDIEVSVQDL